MTDQKKILVHIFLFTKAVLKWKENYANRILRIFKF